MLCRLRLLLPLPPLKTAKEAGSYRQADYFLSSVTFEAGGRKLQVRRVARSIHSENLFFNAAYRIVEAQKIAWYTPALLNQCNR
jgi:hypothetical protein